VGESSVQCEERIAVVPRKILAVFVISLPVLVTMFAVLMAGYLLAGGIGDVGGQKALGGVAIGVLVLLGVDIVLLVGAMGVNNLERSESRQDLSDRNP
jgi:Na+-driven multidrug efflux pump